MALGLLSEPKNVQSFVIKSIYMFFVVFSLDSQPQAHSINNVHTHSSPWLSGNQSITLTCGPRTPEVGQDRDRYCNIMNTPVTHRAKKGNTTKNDTFIIIHDSHICMIYAI